MCRRLAAWSPRSTHHEKDRSVESTRENQGKQGNLVSQQGKSRPVHLSQQTRLVQRMPGRSAADLEPGARWLHHQCSLVYGSQRCLCCRILAPHVTREGELVSRLRRLSG